MSRDLITASHQQITNDWWSERKEKFGVFVSQLVIQESLGTPHTFTVYIL